MNRTELLTTLAEQIAALRLPHPARVAIDGPTAAGKTTLADELTTQLEQLGRPVIRASIDGFHHPKAHRYQRGQSPDAYYHDSFNYPAIRSEVLEPLGPGGSGVYRPAVFDFRTDSQVESEIAQADSRAVLLFDGVMLLRAELDDCWDYRIFVHVDTHTSAGRAERRDLDRFGSADAVREKYLGRYMPAQQHYVSEARPHERADAIIINDQPDTPILLRPHGAADYSRRTTSQPANT